MNVMHERLMASVLKFPFHHFLPSLKKITLSCENGSQHKVKMDRTKNTVPYKNKTNPQFLRRNPTHSQYNIAFQCVCDMVVKVLNW